MANKGILNPEERVELIEGVIMPMAAKKPPHSAITQSASDYLRELFLGMALVRVQEPIYLNSRSEPEPDIAIVRHDVRRYIDHHPTPEEVLLVVEVADRTLSFDCKRKVKLYSQAGIADYWVIDVKQQRVFVFRELADKTYQQETVWSKDAVVRAVAFPDIAVSLTRFFP